MSKIAKTWLRMMAHAMEEGKAAFRAEGSSAEVFRARVAEWLTNLPTPIAIAVSPNA